MAKVLSIVPAQAGWFSLYEEGDGSKSEVPVALWALVEDDENPELRWSTSFSPGDGDKAGLSMTDDEAANFAGYVYRAPG